MIRKIIKVVSLAMALVAILVMALPAPVFAQDYPDVEDYYYVSNRAVSVYDMDGTRVAVYRGFGVLFSEQTDNVVSGYLDLYDVASIRGTYVLDGDGDITLNTRRLLEGDNTITVTTFGNHQIVLPTGVEAVATSGTATVTGSPLALAEGGTRTIPTTGNGDFTLTITRTYTCIGEFAGVIGEGNKPRFQLIGTQIYATATENTATVTGSPVKCIPASTVIDISGAGTVDIAVPYGMEGTATSGTATISGSPVSLPGGETTQIDSGATTGTVTIGLQLSVGFSLSGCFGVNRAGAVVYMKGRVDGFLITDHEEWTTYMVNQAFKAPLGTRPGD